MTIKKIDQKIFFTDGHTRAYLAYEAGWEKVPVIWDEDDLDWDAYLTCVNEAEASGIWTIADLSTRILSEADYQKNWRDWCRRVFQNN